MITRRSMIAKTAALVLIIGPFLFCQATAENKPVVRVKGSNEWANNVAGWASRFMAEKPGVSVIVSGGGTRSGIEAVYRHEAEIALAAHFLDQDQKKTAVDLGIDLQERLVSWDAVVVFVNRENPVTSLTIDQARGLFMGQTTRWDSVGGRDAPVETYIEEYPKSETAMLIRKLVLQGADFASNANVRRYPKFILQAVSGNKNGVGYAPLDRVIEFQSAFPVKLLAIRQTEHDTAVLPSKDTVANRTYPVILPLFFYWDGKSASKPVMDFVAFCDEKGRLGGAR